MSSGPVVVRFAPEQKARPSPVRIAQRNPCSGFSTCESAWDRPPIMRGAIALSVFGSFRRRIATRSSASTMMSSNAVIVLMGTSSRFLARLRFVSRDECRRRLAETLQIDSAGAGNVAHGKFKRRKTHVVGKMLVPLRAGIRRPDEVLQGGFARLLIGGKRRGNVVRVAFQAAREGDRVFHCQARTRTDGEMRHVQGIADKYAIAHGPALVPDFRK